MSIPGFTLSPCTLDDIESMIHVYQAAFASNHFSNLTFPPATVAPASKAAWLRKRFLKYFAQPEIRNFKLVEDSTGRLVAWTRWAFPHVFSEQEKEERRREAEQKAALPSNERWPEGSNYEACELKFGGLDVYRQKYVDGENMYHIHFLATDPAYQRKGLGTVLLKHGLDLADAEGRKAYIEATEDGRPLYLKLGWKDLDRLVVDAFGGDRPAVNYIMIRDPQPIN
ncbi:acyl-CoA N-acyltransferase [Xylogone sp. PMI_703]|nr:acyl-CoA N-acyltransferase [Xylogone sp. PMI_703]